MSEKSEKSENNEENGRKERRVVITGLGAITPLGHGAGGLWRGVKCERSAIGPLTRFDSSLYASRCAGEILDFDPADYLEGKTLKRLDRFAQFSVAATRQAIEDSALDLTAEDPERIGLCIGSALGGVALAEAQHIRFRELGPKSVSPMLALHTFVGSGSCNAAIEFGLRGYTSSNADSCASGAIAIGNAWHAIRRGDADLMLAGGAEAPLAPLCFGAFSFIHAMSRRNDDPEAACRPFDSERDGFVMAEGAAVLLLEEREHAIRRGAKIYAELAGFSSTNDAFHMAAPRPDVAASTRCIELALQAADLAPDAIDYIGAHGSATKLGDSAETLAIKKALGEEVAARVPVSSTKAMHGHALGATGAIEAAICLLALQNDWIPPTLNLDNPSPDCDLDFVPLTGRPARLNAILSTSFGFGGLNAALIFKRDAGGNNGGPQRQIT